MFKKTYFMSVRRYDKKTKSKRLGKSFSIFDVYFFESFMEKFNYHLDDIENKQNCVAMVTDIRRID